MSAKPSYFQRFCRKWERVRERYRARATTRAVSTKPSYFERLCREWEQVRERYRARAITRNCPVCGETTSSPFCRSQDGYDFVICSGCGMLYATEYLPMSFWNDTYGQLPNIRAIDNERLAQRHTNKGPIAQSDRERFEGYLGRVEPYLRSLTGLRYLDVGTYYGDALRIAKERGLQPFGIEGKPDVAHAAAQELNIPIASGCSETMDVPVFGGNFDLVSAYEVLEHSPDPGESLRRIHSNMSDRGVLIVTVPNADNIEVQVLKEQCDHLLGGVRMTGHINLFSRSTLNRLLSQTGFETVEVFTQFGSSLYRLYYHGTGRHDAILNYKRAISGPVVVPPVSDEVVAVMNVLQPQFNQWEIQAGHGPILGIVARKAG